MNNQAVYATPFEEMFRRLTPAERRELLDSIREYGVQMPITVYQSPKHGPSIIDGMNRWSVCQELGISCPVNNVGEIKDSDARDLAEAMNLARRHLSPADWRVMSLARANRIKRVKEKRKEGKSLRVIAEEEGVSVKTVHMDLEEQPSVTPVTVEPPSECPPAPTPEPEPPPVITGKNGKTYRQATKPKPPPPAPPKVTQPATDQSATNAGDVAADLKALAQELTTAVGLLSALAAKADQQRKIDVSKARRLLSELNLVLRGA
jgi:hypothetical protein